MVKCTSSSHPSMAEQVHYAANFLRMKPSPARPPDSMRRDDGSGVFVGVVFDHVPGLLKTYASPVQPFGLTAALTV